MTSATNARGDWRAARVPGRLRVSESQRDLLRKLVADKYALISLIVFLTIVAAAVAAPFVAPYDPSKQDLVRRLRPPVFDARGDAAHLLGTDYLGRDMLSRIIFGARISLFVGAVTVGIVAVVGTLIGLVSGLLRGKVEQALMAVTDIIMAFPGILLLLTVAAMLGPSITTIVLALSIRFWTTFSRIAHSLTLSIRETEYVLAAKVVGCSTPRVIRAHVVPNLLSPILTLTVLEAARIMLAEAGVSFLGFGIQAPMVSWGLMMSEGRNYLSSAWWTVTLPGLALFITILSMISVQSFLRIATDPLQRRTSG